MLEDQAYKNHWTNVNRSLDSIKDYFVSGSSDVSKIKEIIFDVTKDDVINNIGVNCSMFHLINPEQIMEIIERLEKTFDIKINDDTINFYAFYSLSTIFKLVRSNYE